MSTGPFTLNPKYIEVFDHASGTMYSSGTNVLADAYALVVAGTITGHAPDSDHRISMFIPPGVFAIDPIDLDTAYVDVYGAGRDLTELVGDGTADSASQLVKQSAAHARLSSMKIHATAGNAFDQGASVSVDDGGRVSDVTFAVDGGGSASGIVNARGIIENPIFALTDASGFGMGTIKSGSIIVNPRLIGVGSLFNNADGGLVQGGYIDADYVGVNAPTAALEFNGTAFRGGTFADAQYLRLVNCSSNVAGLLELASNTPNVEIVGGVYTATPFAADDGYTMSVSVAGQPSFPSTIATGSGTLTLVGSGFTILKDGTAAAYDGQLVYNATADTYHGQQNGTGKTFDVS